MGCSDCGNSSGGCSGSSSCGSGCGGDCGQPKAYITKTGLQGDKGDTGDNASYFFELNQTIDFLDTFVMVNPNAGPQLSLGLVTLVASALGVGKSYAIGTPVKITPTAHRGNEGSTTAPVPKMEGIVVSYDTSTGALIFKVLGVSGIGTFDDWDVDLAWHKSTATYLNGMNLPPTGAGSSHGAIVVPGNTIFAVEQIIKININGILSASANAMEVLYDGVVCFNQVNTVGSNFQLEILITLGYYVTISTKLTTEAGTDDTIQHLGMNDPTYLFSTYKPNFKTEKVITFTNYSSQPFVVYSGIGVRL